ncbi:hypothetical protein PFISCL1PPCAC_10983, partial [Pristionchus fissidentatus]
VRPPLALHSGPSTHNRMDIARAWRVVVLALILYTVSPVESVAGDVHIQVACQLQGEDPLVQKITSLASTKAFVHTTTSSKVATDKCFDSVANKKNAGLILITNDLSCNKTVYQRRLALFFDSAAQKLTAHNGKSVNVTGDWTVLNELLATLVQDVLKDAPTRLNSDSSVGVPVWTIVAVGVIMG